MDAIRKFYDSVFGNRDGKFTAADLPNYAVSIVVLVVDLVMVVAEYRVWSVGKMLTNNGMLALGFVAVSSLPFYVGQIAFLYNRANIWQKLVSVAMVIMGLGTSAYYGFADYIIAENAVIVAGGANLPIDTSTLYLLAVVSTVALIVSGLFYALVDDSISQNLRANRIRAKAQVAENEIAVKRQLLAQLTALRAEENALRAQYPEDYQELHEQFVGAAKGNPTRGNGTK